MDFEALGKLKPFDSHSRVEQVHQWEGYLIKMFGYLPLKSHMVSVKSVPPRQHKLPSVCFTILIHLENELE